MASNRNGTSLAESKSETDRESLSLNAFTGEQSHLERVDSLECAEYA